jgi:hypothetical protein
MQLDSLIWGPNFWFFLHTIAICYSLTPNETIKKKYYNFIQTIPLLLPDEEMGKHFSKILDDYPVMPYLDSRESFTKWMHFIHNRVNIHLNKPIMSYKDSMIEYYKNYKPKKEVKKEDLKMREKIIFFSLLLVLLIIIVILSLRE